MHDERAGAPFEETVEPDLPIIDSHQHFRDRPGDHYLLPDLLRDLAPGHNILATVAVECGTMYRALGPAELRPVGETEFLNGIAAMSASGQYGPTAIAAGIIGFADLSLGEAVRPVLDAVTAAAGGRLCGIRNPVAWHDSADLRQTRVAPADGRLADPMFRAGAACLASRGLPLDVWIYHRQLGRLAEFARALPDLTIVVNHLGGPLGAGPYADKQNEVLADWQAGIKQLAQLPNVRIKLGGLGMPIMGFGLDRRTGLATSAQLAQLWRPYVLWCIEAFGVDRCMFESNFPPDQVSARYHALWNAFKHIVADATTAEKLRIFAGTARDVYRLSLPD